MKKTGKRLPTSRLALYIIALLRIEPKMTLQEIRMSLEPLCGCSVNPGTVYRMLQSLTESKHLRQLEDRTYRPTESGVRELKRHVDGINRIMAGDVE